MQDSAHAPTFRPHLVLLPHPTQEEVDAATSAHDVLSTYDQAEVALHDARKKRPSEDEQIRDEFAAFLIAILTGSAEASALDHFGLLPHLSNLPRVVLAMTYNYMLCDDFVRETTSVNAPLQRQPV